MKVHHPRSRREPSLELWRARRSPTSKRRLSLLLPFVLVLALSVASCTGDAATVPLSSWAKHYVPRGTLGPDQITIPFPITDRFSNGEERWFLDRDTSGQLVLRVNWRDQIVNTFPIDGTGTRPAGGEIALGGRNYRIISITVNPAGASSGSGWVVLEPVSGLG